MNITGMRKALNMILNTLDTTKLSVSPIEFGERKPQFELRENSFFEGVSPESCGISSIAAAEFINELWKNRNVGLQSIMLMRGDKVFFEADVGNQDSRLPKATFSECKSIVSLAIGMLVTQGKLRLSEKVADIFAEKALPISKIRLKGLTVKHLLTMTACVTFNEIEAMVTEDWIRGFINSNTEGEFGKSFRYNSLNSYILAAIVVERTGMSLSEYLDSTIFGRLEITDYYWEKCPNGIEKGGWGLYIRREDLAKIGLLVMNKGYWRGKRLISPRYISDATKLQAEAPREYGDYNYGFHIWIGREKNSFLFNGMLGQNLIGYRDSGIMIIANCGNCDLFQQNDFFGICEKYLGGSFPESIPENDDAYEALLTLKARMKNDNEIKSFLEVRNNGRDISADIAAIDGKRFGIDSSNGISTGFAPLAMQFIQGNFTFGLLEIGFRRSENGLYMDFLEEDESHTVEIGFDEAITGNVSFHGEIFAVAAKGYFADNEDGIPTLKVVCDFLETPYSRIYKLFFESGNYRCIFCENPAYGVFEKAFEIKQLLGENAEKLESIFSKIDGDYFNVKLEKSIAPKLSLKEI